MNQTPAKSGFDCPSCGMGVIRRKPVLEELFG